MLAHERIGTEAGEGTTDQECLDITVLAINCTVGPEGLCRALLVSGALLRLARTTPASTQLENARLIEFSVKEATKE